jgi:class 3 adenylate cyclase/CheY-like chemotaxis protein
MNRSVSRPSKILVVDDTAQNRRLMEAVLAPLGHSVSGVESGPEALEMIAADPPDLVLLDVVMPEMDGYAVCRALRANPDTQMLPIIMLTSSGDQDKVGAIEAGADDFIARPFDQNELVARVRSLLRIKHYHDTIQAQTAELEELNRTLESRVQAQVDELEHLGRLRRFLSQQIADLIVSANDDSVLDSHRREITVVFCDLRGFTAFSETAEPEEVMNVLGEFHGELGKLIFEYGGTLERFAGDALMMFFNDPFPTPDAPLKAVRMAVAMQERVAGLQAGWRKRGHDLALGIGIALGFATLGRIGFEGRFDYGAVGSVVNLAARLCGEALGGQILLAERAYAAVEGVVAAEPVGPLTLKGFHRPVPAFLVTDMQIPDTISVPVADAAVERS